MRSNVQSDKSCAYKTEHDDKLKQLMSAQRERRLVYTKQKGTWCSWKEGAGEKETAQVRMGRGSHASLLTGWRGYCPPPGFAHLRFLRKVILSWRLPHVWHGCQEQELLFGTVG